MSKEISERRDLLGDPIPDNWGRRGRPAHIPTERNRRKVRLLLAFGWVDRRIARSLRITVKTLRKHYFPELRHRDEARPALEAERIMLVYDAAVGGNVGAMKELGRLIERDELARVPQRPESETPERLGKKEAAARAATSAHEGTGWANLLH